MEIQNWAVSLSKYSAVFLSAEIVDYRIYIRKLRYFFVVGGLHTKFDLDRFFVPREEGRRGLTSIKVV